MKARVKYLILNLRKREPGTYKKDVHEDVWELDVPELDDLGAIGQELHDRMELPRSRFVKVLGAEELPEDA